MKLWLDDVRPAPEGWWAAKTLEAAKLIIIYKVGLERQSFEECSLDHDLGMGDQNDGIKFVDWMAENNIWPTKKPVVHSMNPVGRGRMEMTINRYFPGEE